MSITKITEKYISEHPSIKDCMAKGLINYSALSREICDFYKIKSFDAVLIACRRYYSKAKGQDIHEKKIIDLVKKVKLIVRNKIIAVILEKPNDMSKLYHLQKEIDRKEGDFNLIEGENVVTIITNSDFKERLKSSFRLKVVSIAENLVQITMIFDKRIETTSGVVSYIYSLLAQNGINIREEMSCWTDFMIVIDEKDLAAAMKVLSF